ncbi:MAG TPA: hypothetical protein VMV79_04455 [Alphaproteobacteria bacterium]|nr:hypothetical protein [Alphaproteobacteria bacterium]
MKTPNIHTTREGWLRAAANELRPYFEKIGYALPENIRFAIAFTSSGKRGKKAAECWHQSSSADRHYEIIIRADIADPVEVLGRLVPQLIHVLLPIEARHGKSYRDIAMRVGLEGPMRQAVPSALLKERLQALALTLGPLPHGKLDFAARAGSRKKSGSRFLKAECGKCGYAIRIIPKWAKIGLPACPANAKHGLLICDIPEESEDKEPDSGDKDAG